MRKPKLEQPKLKPCPFCGGEAKLYNCLYDCISTYAGESYVICTACGASTKYYPISAEYSSDEKAVGAWNKRNGEQDG